MPMQIITTKNLKLLLLVAACSFNQGCNSGNPIASVTGVVTIDGVPFTTGKVIFSPIAKEGQIKAGRAAVGSLDTDGRFVLGTHQKDDGALVGQHRVTLFHSAEKSPYKFTRLTYPDKYFTVVGGQENFIELTFTGEQVKKYGNSK